MENVAVNVIELIILFISAVITLCIYWMGKCTERQHAARIIVMQIDTMDTNIKLAMHMLGNNANEFSVSGFWKSENIIENNLWEKYRHLFVKKLDYDQIVSMNIFYESALSMANQQQEIKMLISSINKNFYIKTSHLTQDELRQETKDGEPYMRCASMYLETMQEQYQMILKKRDSIPYEQMKKIAKLKY